MATDKITSALWQARPVFISSTFKDMQAERDYLRHVVFPRLEEELRKGRLLLEPIDLRQGVETAELGSEEARERLVLKVCLEEIQRSRPFLIVLLGDRYGWVPPAERMMAATQEVGFDSDIRDKSVTALEIEFGILKQSPEQRRRCFFYFREPLLYDRMPPDIAASFSDECAADPPTRARHGRLAALKQSLADDPELAPRVHHYHVDWDALASKVTGLDAKREDAFGEMVYRHLLAELDEEIRAAASQPPQTWEGQERAALVEFIEHRRRDFVGRKRLLDDLTNIALSPSLPDAVFAIPSGMTWGACVTGEPGSGKSAIFAELVRRLSGDDSSSRSRETSDDSILLLTNAAGATPRGSQVAAMLERFIEELADALGIANPLPEQATPDDVDATFASLLVRVAVKRRVVVLLDALNQFDPTPRAQHLTWLRPKQWPGNARLIATGLSGIRSDRSVGGSPASLVGNSPAPRAGISGEPPELRPTEALSQWAGIEKLDVPPLTIADDDTDDVTAIAKSVWRRYHRQANPAVLRVLKEKRLPDGSFAAGNPLWLTLALEQINLLDADDFARAEREFSDRPQHERVTAMLVDTADRMPPSVAELYDLLLAQTERIFGVAPARAFAAVIAVSRFGWRETDLLPLIPVAARVLCPEEPVPELDDLRLAALRRSFRAHLARRGTLGQLDFFHAQMRQAVLVRNLSDASTRFALHGKLADHLESLPNDDPLRENELMWHFIGADEPLRAARHYAAHLSAGASAAATAALAQHTMELPAGCSWVLSLLATEELNRTASNILCKRYVFDLFDALRDEPDIGIRRAVLEAARNKLLELVRWQSSNGDISPVDRGETIRSLSVSTARVGDLVLKQGDVSSALNYYRDSLNMSEDLAQGMPTVANRHDVMVALGKLGEVFSMQDDLTGAAEVAKRALVIARDLPPNPSHLRGLVVALANLGASLEPFDVDGALAAYTESVQVAERLVKLDASQAEWRWDLAISQLGLGDVLTVKGRYPDALTAYGSASTIVEQLALQLPTALEMRRMLGVTFSKIAIVYVLAGDNISAIAVCRRGLATLELLVQRDPANASWQKDLLETELTMVRLQVNSCHLVEAKFFHNHAQARLGSLQASGSYLTSAVLEPLVRELRILQDSIDSPPQPKGNSTNRRNMP